MKKIKSVRKAWKKFAAVFLSMVLTVGLMSGALPIEVLAADDKIVITGQLTLEGYEGDGDIPETLIFGGHTLYRNSDEEKPIPAGECNIIDGNVVVWRIEIEPEAGMRQICLNVQNRNMNSDTGEPCWTWNVSGDFSVPQVYTFETTLYRIRLMDVNRFYRDIYIGKDWAFKSLPLSMSAPVTMKANHVFEGWNTLEGNFSLEMTASEPLILYAHYSGHPAKETWVWNHDESGHWLECTCGERVNAEAHLWDTGRVVTEPTDTDPGEKVFRCTHANCGYERSEVIRSTINYSIIMNGYNSGGELPNTANIELWLWKEGSSTEEPSQKVALRRTRIEGNQFFYSCDIQDLDTYAAAYIVDGSGFRFPLVNAFLQDGVYEKEFEYYRFRFMNGNEVYNEQYLFSSTWLQVPPAPVKENRVFVGWETSDGTIVDLDALKADGVMRQKTLYAVWRRPDGEDVPTKKEDGDIHWREYSDGDIEDWHEAEWIEVSSKEPTDTEPGKKVYLCETCGLMKEEIIPVKGSETEGGDEGGGDETGGGTGTEGGGSETGGGTGTEGGGSQTGGGTGTEGGGSQTGGGTGTEGGGSETGGGTGTEGGGNESGSGTGTEGGGNESGSGTGTEGGGSETGGGTGTEGGGETGGGTGTEGGSETGGGTGTEGGNESGGGTGTEGGGNESGGGTGAEGGGNESGSGTGTEGGSETGGGTGTEGGGNESGSGTGTEGGSETGGGTGTEGGGNESGGGTGTEGEGNESGSGTGSEGGSETGGGTGTEGGGNESGSGTGTEGGNESGSGTGTDGGGSSTGGNGSGTGNTGNGSGTGNTGSGSGAGGTGSGNVAGGTGSGSGAGGTGSGNVAGGTGSGTGNAGSGSVFGNADSVMGSGAGRAGAADGTGTGDEIANEADGAGTESVDRGGSGATHGNNRSMENGNTSYTAQNTSTANNDDAAVNSGRRTGRDDEPDTGDITHVEIYATIAMIAGLSYLLSYFRDENHGITEEEKNEMVAKLIGWAKKGGYFRKKLALAAIFLLLVYYHSIGKRVSVTYRLAEEEIL